MVDRLPRASFSLPVFTCEDWHLGLMWPPTRSLMLLSIQRNKKGFKLDTKLKALTQNGLTKNWIQAFSTKYLQPCCLWPEMPRIPTLILYWHIAQFGCFFSRSNSVRGSMCVFFNQWQINFSFCGTDKHAWMVNSSSCCSIIVCASVYSTFFIRRHSADTLHQLFSFLSQLESRIGEWGGGVRTVVGWRRPTVAAQRHTAHSEWL